MNGRRDDPRGRRAGGPWFIAGATLAVVATALLVLAEDLRWLRLGIVAALWAALAAGFLATQYRKQAEASRDSVAEAQSVYELELEREIAARREYELQAEAEIRRKVEAESRDQLAALRAEVTALKESLQQLFGGEVLYERVALTAQSTRMRPLNEEPKYLTHAPAAKPAQITTAAVRGAAIESFDARTELIARVLETDAPVRQQARREPPQPPHREPPRRGPADSRPSASRPGTADLPKRSSTAAPLFSAEPFSMRPKAAAPAEPSDPEPRDSGDVDGSSLFQPTTDAKGAAPAAPAQDRSSLFANATLPEPVRQIQSENRPAGRRRKPEPPEGTPVSGGRRRRPEGDSGRTFFDDLTGVRAGRHADGPATGTEPDSGSHSSGKSVAELLASLGSSDTPRRRRRRDGDD